MPFVINIVFLYDKNIDMHVYTIRIKGRFIMGLLNIFKEIAAQKTSTATATMSNEDDFSFNTADLEESSILNDTDFEVEDFEMEEGDEL